MLSDDEIISLAQTYFDKYNLSNSGWTFEIFDDLDGVAGFTFFDTKRIELSREFWPTFDSNIKELVRHEIAHAICGHGRHDLEWWNKLIEIGGSGTWLGEDGLPANWSWTLSKIQNTLINIS